MCVCQVPETIEESAKDDSNELLSMSQTSKAGWYVAKRSGSLTSRPSSCDKFSDSVNKSIRNKQ